MTVLGLGRSGLSAARFLKRRGAQVFVSDSAPESKVLEIAKRELTDEKIDFELGGHTDKAIDDADLFVISPGIPPTAPIVKKAKATGCEVISDIELAHRLTAAPIIAVTGTNGKSTTTALISYILEQSGKRAPACGNIGVPILSLLEQPLDFLIAEVSSFQLEYSPTFAPFVGVWLNLTPDHIDWHGNLDSYINAKRSMFEHQAMSQYAVFNVDDPVVSTTATVAEIFPISTDTQLEGHVQGAYISDDFLCVRRRMREHVLLHESELSIRGKHNMENALAAAAATILADCDPETVTEALKTFKALEHRLEFVATVDGTEFYNDSKATNTVSAIKALQSFPDHSVVLIAGGKDKGTSLTEFVHVVRKHASAVILIGEASDRFEESLRQGGIDRVYPVATLEDAVNLGLQLKSGPVVLSPACASFDMFKDYEDRGRVFKDIVRRRVKEVASST